MEIETRRLIIRDFQLEDWEQLAPILADPRVMQFERETLFDGIKMDVYKIPSPNSLPSSTSTR